MNAPDRFKPGDIVGEETVLTVSASCQFLKAEQGEIPALTFCMMERRRPGHGLRNTDNK